MPNARSCSDWRLYVILDPRAAAGRDLARIAELAIRGGADALQLRDKHGTARDALDQARRILAAARPSGVPLLINDRVDLAIAAEADGVHLGQDDLPVKEARRIIGPEALIGVSTHNLEQVRQAVLDGASYLGVGPTFPSGTKAFSAVSGLEFVRQALAVTSLPAFVIGGVNLENVGAAVAAGARRIAVSQALCQVEDPRIQAAALRNALLTNP